MWDSFLRLFNPNSWNAKKIRTGIFSFITFAEHETKYRSNLFSSPTFSDCISQTDFKASRIVFCNTMCHIHYYPMGLCISTPSTLDHKFLMSPGVLLNGKPTWKGFISNTIYWNEDTNVWEALWTYILYTTHFYFCVWCTVRWWVITIIV